MDSLCLVVQMAGGHQLARQLNEAALLNEAKTAKQEAEHEAQQEVALQKKKQDQRRQQQLMFQVRQQQVEPPLFLIDWGDKCCQNMRLCSMRCRFHSACQGGKQCLVYKQQRAQ